VPCQLPPRGGAPCRPIQCRAAGSRVAARRRFRVIKRVLVRCASSLARAPVPARSHAHAPGQAGPYLLPVGKCSRAQVRRARPSAASSGRPLRVSREIPAARVVAYVPRARPSAVPYRAVPGVPVRQCAERSGRWAGVPCPNRFVRAASFLPSCVVLFGPGRAIIFRAIPKKS
jgi:hypothetical protein